MAAKNAPMAMLICRNASSSPPTHVTMPAIFDAPPSAPSPRSSPVRFGMLATMDARRGGGATAGVGSGGLGAGVGAGVGAGATGGAMGACTVASAAGAGSAGVDGTHGLGGMGMLAGEGARGTCGVGRGGPSVSRR